MKSKHRQHESEHPSPDQTAPAADGAAPAGTPPAEDAAPSSSAAGGQAAAPAKNAELEALKDRMLRLQADFDNFRKRTLREKTELYRLANEDLMTALLPVLDHLDLALGSLAAHGDAKAFADGVRMVAEQLRSVLGKFGLGVLGAAGGDPFDPNLHEAISHLPSAEVAADRVAMQVRPGYQLGDKLLRPTQVVVSCGPPPAAAPAAPAGPDAGTNPAKT
jgi:molecular chaperone GrpE